MSRFSAEMGQITRIRILQLGVCLMACWVYLSTLAPSITWENYGADSAELALAAAEAGIAHPPSYPSYILLAHLWQKIPFAEDLALRLNLFSCFWALISIYLLMLLCQKILAKYALSSWGIGFAGLILAFAPLVWSQAVITEVYTMGLAVLNLIVLLFWEYQEKGGTWRLATIGGLIGLGYGVMPSIAFSLFPIGGAILSLPSSNQQKLKNCGLLLLSCGLGLSIFLYLPLRAAMNPLANWGRPRSWDQFWWMFTGAQYQQFWGIGSFAQLAERLKELLALLSLNLELWAILPCCIGAAWLFKQEKGFCGLLLSIAGFSILQTLAYRVEGYPVYLMPCLLVLALGGGIGICLILKRLKAVQRLFVLSIGLLVLLHLAIWYPSLNRSQDNAALDFALSTISVLPRDAVVLSHTDESSFALWYGQSRLKRWDIIIIDSRLLLYAWYIENLLVQHPALDRRWLRYGGLTGLDNPLYEIQGDRPDYILQPLR